MSQNNNNIRLLEQSDIGVPRDDIGCKYHYTTIKALRGIVESNTLWVSNAMFLNDKSEVRYAREIVEETIKENQNIENEVIKVIENFMQQIIDNSEQIFVLSTSNNKDSQLLWSDYSRSDGYCLGFDFSEVWDSLYIKSNKDAENEEIKNLNFKQNMRIDRVIYDKQEQMEFIKRPLLKINKFYKNNPEKDLKKFMHYFFHVLMMFKNPRFKQEEEFRIVFYIPDSKKYVNYYVANGILIPYIEVHFNKKIPLKYIKIGPRNNIDIAKASIESFLRSKSFKEVEVTKSDIPLRF